MSISVSAAPAGWTLAWKDDFNRPAVGDGWDLLQGRARIVDGQLLLEGAGATIVTTRPFAEEVRVAFVARSAPDRPPCDLSSSLLAYELLPYEASPPRPMLTESS